VIPLPGGTQDEDNFECIAVVAVVRVQELIQNKLSFYTESVHK